MTIPLAFTDNAFALSVSSFQANSEVIFKKEPAYGDPGSVQRGTLPVGERTSDYLGYAWDVAGGKIYIDANRDLDLTNDPAVECRHGLSNFLSAEGISLSLTQNNVPVRYRFDMQSFGSSYTLITMRSGWVGEFDCDGKRYKLGVADNLDGRLGRGDSFLLTEPGAPAAEEPAEEPAPSMLVLNGTPYTLEFAFAPGPGETGAVATLTKVAQGLGELRIEGTSVKRVLLFTNSVTVQRPGQAAAEPEDRLAVCTIDRPGTAVRIPAGSYSVCDVYLDNGLHWAARQSPGGGESVAVKEARPSTLKVGGPLEPSIQVTGSGRVLSLSYELTGAHDKPFAPYVGWTSIGGVTKRDQNPTFEVYADGTKVGEGQFEYG